MTMLEGTIAKWLKKEGDFVKEGEPLLEVESDKVVVEVTSPYSGFVRKIIVQESESVPTGTTLCLIGDEDEEIEEDTTGDSINVTAEVEEVKTEEPAEQEPIRKRKPRISPAARLLVKDLGLDIKKLKGTGPGGLIVKADIECAKEANDLINEHPKKSDEDQNKTSQTTSKEDTEIIPLRGIRKRIAEHMTISKQNVADVTTVAEVDMTKILEYRNILPVSYTSFVVKVAGEALKEYPILNSSLIDNEIHIKKQINICVAISNEDGLITPVIRDVNKKNIIAIAEEIDTLVKKGRDGLLTPDDFAGGTFTVTNSGVFGSLFFTPIINYPQCAVLGMGRVVDTPIVVQKQIVVAPIMYLCLTYDHRIVDGAPAVKFLQRIKHYLENPKEILS